MVATDPNDVQFMWERATTVLFFGSTDFRLAFPRDKTASWHNSKASSIPRITVIERFCRTSYISGVERFDLFLAM